MKTINYTDKPLEHIPEKVLAIKRANDRLTRLLPAEHFACVVMSTRMSRVACAKSWHASPRLRTVKGKHGAPPSASMRAANGCSTCDIGRDHHRGIVPSTVPAVTAPELHASAGTSTSTATMRRDLGITAKRSQGLRSR